MITGVHSFSDNLAKSVSTEHSDAWNAFYMKAFPNLLKVVPVDVDCDLQRRGVDKIVILRDGKQYTVDEKLRFGDHQDILLEIDSVGHLDIDGVYTSETPGWAVDKKKTCDFIAYAIPKLHRCYLLNYHLLRMTSLTLKEHWINSDGKGVKIIYAKNAGYETRSVAITYQMLSARMNNSQILEFGSVPLKDR